MINKEELYPQLVEYYERFGRAYIATGDLERARYFVTLADEMWVLYGGEEHENIEGMRELWKTLQDIERLSAEEE